MEKFISAPKALQLFEALILDTPKKKTGNLPAGWKKIYTQNMLGALGILPHA